MNWQTIVVAGLVVTAAGYVALHLARSVFGLGSSSCGDCGTQKIDDFRKTQNREDDSPPDGFVASDDINVGND